MVNLVVEHNHRDPLNENQPECNTIITMQGRTINGKLLTSE